jgi:hypothetical protein
MVSWAGFARRSDSRINLDSQLRSRHPAEKWGRRNKDKIPEVFGAEAD